MVARVSRRVVTASRDSRARTVEGDKGVIAGSTSADTSLTSMAW